MKEYTQLHLDQDAKRRFKKKYGSICEKVNALQDRIMNGNGGGDNVDIKKHPCAVTRRQPTQDVSQPNTATNAATQSMINQSDFIKGLISLGHDVEKILNSTDPEKIQQGLKIKSEINELMEELSNAQTVKPLVFSQQQPASKNMTKADFIPAPALEANAKASDLRNQVDKLLTTFVPAAVDKAINFKHMYAKNDQQSGQPLQPWIILLPISSKLLTNILLGTSLGYIKDPKVSLELQKTPGTQKSWKGFDVSGVKASISSETPGVGATCQYTDWQKSPSSLDSYENFIVAMLNDYPDTSGQFVFNPNSWVQIKLSELQSSVNDIDAMIQAEIAQNPMVFLGKICDPETIKDLNKFKQDQEKEKQQSFDWQNFASQIPGALTKAIDHEKTQDPKNAPQMSTLVEEAIQATMKAYDNKPSAKSRSRLTTKG